MGESRPSLDLAFVILHYLTAEDTLAFVASIRERIDTDRYKIVVVDNASGNGSLEKLREAFSGQEDIAIVENSENLGYARGLNAGISYARARWQPRFVAVCNNDLLLLSRDLCAVLENKYAGTQFAVLGPMMITRDGRCSVNPVRRGHRSRQEAERLLARRRRMLLLCRLHLYGAWHFLSGLRRRQPAVPAPEKYLQDQTDFKLHGAMWVLSPAYFERFEGLDPATFLYGEEELLLLHVLKNGLHTLYTPDIAIFHREDSATETAMPSSTRKTAFVSTHTIDSLQIYLKTLDAYEQNGKGAAG